MNKNMACPPKPRRRRVICAMSGGVDSSVAAALLKEQGYEVIGVFMKLWAENVPSTDLVRENICCSADAAAAARAVANHLGIPFYTVNFAEEFRKTVVENYIKEYEEGRTPNPCVICNRDIKGEVLFKKMKELGGDYLATGHYARIRQVKSNRSKVIAEYHLLRGVDRTKDQTYFLWTLTQEKLAHLLFPVGDLTKSEVRKIAARFDLPTAQRRESQGLCFIPDRDVCGFLRRHAKKLTKPGLIKNLEGEVIGQHVGLINYTIGQRERLGLGGPRAYYVVELNSQDNVLVVGDDKDLYHKALVATNLNWIQKPSKNIKATIRYGHPATSCNTEILNEKEIKVTFTKAQRAITPGQSIVFYVNDELIGGGIIEKIVK